MTKKFEPYQGKEAHFQTTVARYLDSIGVLWFHSPNGGSRNRLEAVSLKRQGVKAGVSDVIILEPRGEHHGFFLELKVKTNKPQKTQKDFMNKAVERGYKCAWTNSLDEAIELIEEYLNT